MDFSEESLIDEKEEELVVIHSGHRISVVYEDNLPTNRSIKFFVTLLLVVCQYSFSDLIFY